MTAFSARIWLEVPADSAPLKITSPDGTISPGNWLATQAEKARLSDVIIPITTDDWKRATINFTSETDTLVTLSLLGPWNEKSAPEYVLYDQLSLTGATLANLSFEEKEGPGFRSWQSPEIPFGQWLIVNEVALDGDNIAPAWNNTPIAQSIAVKAGVPVLLTLFAKAALPPAKSSGASILATPGKSLRPFPGKSNTPRKTSTTPPPRASITCAFPFPGSTISFVKTAAPRFRPSSSPRSIPSSIVPWKRRCTSSSIGIISMTSPAPRCLSTAIC
ncbi:MAG: hypothetical protein QNL33_11040 [Akkermansiaceae bacterium]